MTEEEIGRMVALLCSADFDDFVTGRAIVMDGRRPHLALVVFPA